MTDKERQDIIRLVATSDRLWSELREYNEEIIDFLCKGEISENTNKFLSMSLQLIIFELLVNKEKYEKYPPKDYKMEDFVQMAIVNPTQKGIDYENSEECKSFIEEVRSIMWGYVKQHYDDIADLFLSLNENEERINDEEFDRIVECLCVAYIETNFRNRELYFLERDYE